MGTRFIATREASVQPGYKQMLEELTHAKAWKDIWSGGQGTGQIQDVPPAGELCERLIQEYDDTCRELADVVGR